MNKAVEIVRTPVTEEPPKRQSPLAETEALLRELLQETRKANRRTTPAEVETRWLNVNNAAKYCDYSPERFRRLVKQYSIPAHGPKHSRFDRADLDAWMNDPRCFLNRANTYPRRRAGSMEAIQSILWDMARPKFREHLRLLEKEING